MSEQDWTLLLQLVSAGVIPFAVTWLTRVTWPDWLKFTVAVVLSGLAGVLTVASTGQLFDPEASIIQTGAVIFGASQAVYYFAFRALGLERVLFPREAVIHAVEQQANSMVAAQLTQADARAVLQPEDPSTIIITTDRV